MDEIEPFQLDDDFDYDNVTLTPKFSASEMEHLAQFLKQNITTTRVPFAHDASPLVCIKVVLYK